MNNLEFLRLQCRALIEEWEHSIYVNDMNGDYRRRRCRCGEYVSEQANEGASWGCGNLIADLRGVLDTVIDEATFRSLGSTLVSAWTDQLATFQERYHIPCPRCGHPVGTRFNEGATWVYEKAKTWLTQVLDGTFDANVLDHSELLDFTLRGDHGQQ